MFGSSVNRLATNNSTAVILAKTLSEGISYAAMEWAWDAIDQQSLLDQVASQLDGITITSKKTSDLKNNISDIATIVDSRNLGPQIIARRGEILHTDPNGFKNRPGIMVPFNSFAATVTNIGWAPDGLTFYLGMQDETYFKGIASIPYNIASVQWESQLVRTLSSTASIDTRGQHWKPDGLSFFSIDAAQDLVIEQTTTIPYDLNSLVGTVKNAFSIAAQDTTGVELHFNAAGTKMFVLGQQNGRIYEYTLSVAWDISTASYVQFFAVTTTATSFAVSEDGLNLIVVTNSSAVRSHLFSYALAASWSLTTVTKQHRVYLRNCTHPVAMASNPDGKSFQIFDSNVNRIFNYTLTTAWDLRTLTNRDVIVTGEMSSSQDTTPVGIAFSSDGTKIYVVGDTNNYITMYPLSTAWNVNTAGTPVNSALLTTTDSNPRAIEFKPDGTKMWLLGGQTDTLQEYNLSTAWDITTLTAAGISLNVSGRDTEPYGFTFKPDGTKVYIVGDQNDRIYEFNLSNAWTLTGGTFLQQYNITGFNTPTSISFKSDGLTFWLSEWGAQKVWTFKLSTAWDISTAAPDDFISLASTESSGNNAISNPYSVVMSPDGTTAYVCTTNDIVYQFHLKTPYTFVNRYTPEFGYGGSSTAHYTFTQDTEAQDFFISPDGTKLYMLGSTNDKVYQYTLRVPWNVRSAVYVRDFSVASQETGPLGLFFKPDGTRMYVTGSISRTLRQYNLSTAWDISTAVYTSGFALTSSPNIPIPTNIHFNSTGSTAFIFNREATNYTLYRVIFTRPWEVSTGIVATNPGSWSVNAVSSDLSVVNCFAVRPTGQRNMFAFHATESAVIKIKFALNLYRDTVTAYTQSSFNDHLIGSVSNNLFLTNAPRSLKFSTDGSKLFYLLSGSSIGVLHMPSNGCVTSPYDTALPIVKCLTFDRSYSNLEPNRDEATAQAFFFSVCGTMVLTANRSNMGLVKHRLSTPWDLDTAKVEQVQYNEIISYQASLYVSPDGLNIYTCDGSNVNRYVLQRAWDLNTMAYHSQVSCGSNVAGMWFSPNGRFIFLNRPSTVTTVMRYTLKVPWDHSSTVGASLSSTTVTSVQKVYYDHAIASGSSALFISPNGRLACSVDSANKTMILSHTAAPFDRSERYKTETVASLSNLNNVSQIAFSSDGSKLFASAGSRGIVELYVGKE